MTTKVHVSYSILQRKFLAPYKISTFFTCLQVLGRLACYNLIYMGIKSVYRQLKTVAVSRIRMLDLNECMNERLY